MISDAPAWFDRTFSSPFPVDLLPNLRARLAGAAARLDEAVRGHPPEALALRPPGKWSAEEHVRHLVEIESLWLARVEDFIASRDQMTPANLTHRWPEESEPGAAPLATALREFRTARTRLLQRVDGLTASRFTPTIPHPRLRTPMGLADHLYFVAEHDDHHLAHILALLAAAPNDAGPTGWHQEWFPIHGAAYLNTAAQAAMPRVAHDAVAVALDAKRYPHHQRDAVWFNLTDRLRHSLAGLIGAAPADIALTTGASSGLQAVALGLTWAPGDEIVTAKGEFPVQYATWKPLEAREGVTLTMVTPAGRFLTADDLISAMTPRTRVVSVSHVRFDDGSLLDAARVAAACRQRGVLFGLDVTQSCGALPLDVEALGADFLVGAGYKWLLSPYGTGFFWVRPGLVGTARSTPFYWMGQGVESFLALNMVDPAPALSARRWDAPETATYFNLNLTAMEASVAFVQRVGPETVRDHNRHLIARLFAGLPDGLTPASPLNPAERGPYGCFVARTREETTALHQKLLQANVFVSLREGRIRVSPHLFNSERDIDRLLEVVSS